MTPRPDSPRPPGATRRLAALFLATLAAGARADHARRARPPDPPASLFPGKLLHVPPGATQALGHFHRLPSRSAARGALRLRVQVSDPDGSLRALALTIDDGPTIRVDRTAGVAGPLAEGQAGAGFEVEDSTGYLEVPMPARRGPHRLLVEPVVREGAREDRFSAEVRVLGAAFFDARAAYTGIRDLAEVFRRRYRDLRDFDLAVRRVDPRDRGDIEDPLIHDHWGDAEQALFRQTTVDHFALLNDLTYRAHRAKVDPVAWVDEGMARFHLVIDPWMHAPEGRRASLLYAGVPQLYEYLDEVAQGYAAVRDGYYALAGLTREEAGPEAPSAPYPTPDEVAPGDPLEPIGERLDGLRTALERLIEAGAAIHEELEELAFHVAGDPETTGRDFPAAERACRRSRKLPVRLLERRHYRVPGAGPGEVRGVGVAEGEGCCPCPASERRARDIRKDRLRPERRILARYLDRVRKLAHHDLHLVRLWQVWLWPRPWGEEGSPPAPRWRPSGGLRTLRGEDPLTREPGATRIWHVGGGRIRRRLVAE